MKSTILRFSLFLFSVLFFSVLGFSQDEIFLRSGEKIEGKVLEVGPGLMKYKSKTNPEGPVYSKKISDILLITYANGTTEVYEVEKTSASSSKSRNDTNIDVSNHSVAFNFAPLLYQQLEIDYQYLFPKGIIGISFPITYALNPGFTRSSSSLALLWSAGSDLKFFTAGQKAASFYIGVGVDVGQTQSTRYRNEEIIEYDPYTGQNYTNVRYTTEEVNNNFYSVSALVGVELNPTKNISVDLGGRISGRSHFIDNQYNNGPYYEPYQGQGLDLIVRPLMRLRVRF